MNKGIEFLNNIVEPVTLISHNDTDGVCSATLIYTYLKRKGIKVKLYSGDVEERTFSKAEISPVVITVDLPIDSYPEYLNKFNKSKILVIDHHPIKNDLNKQGIVHINPRFDDPNIYKSASEVCYELLKDISYPQEWIMRVGAVGDCSIKGTKKEKLASHIISAIRVIKKTVYLPELVEILSECETIDEFINNKEFLEIKNRFQNEINRLVEEFEKQGVKDINFFEVRSEYSLKAILANVLFDRYPSKSIFVYQKTDDGSYRVSVRSRKFNVGKVLEQLAKEIRGAGGGHEVAGAANVKDIKEFKAKIIELIKSK